MDSISKILDVPNTEGGAGTNGSNLACNKERNNSCSGGFHDTGRFGCVEVCVFSTNFEECPGRAGHHCQQTVNHSSQSSSLMIDDRRNTRWQVMVLHLLRVKIHTASSPSTWYDWCVAPGKRLPVVGSEWTLLTQQIVRNAWLSENTDVGLVGWFRTESCVDGLHNTSTSGSRVNCFSHDDNACLSINACLSTRASVSKLPTMDIDSADRTHHQTCWTLNAEKCSLVMHQTSNWQVKGSQDCFGCVWKWGLDAYSYHDWSDNSQDTRLSALWL